MFGLTMRIEIEKVAVTLRAFKKEELPTLVEGFSSLKVQMWTAQMFAQTLENEQEWFDRLRKSDTDCLWAIVIESEEKPVGITGLNRIDVHGSCTSGIVIWNAKLWGKGIATKAHLGRTLFASDYLNRFTIHTSVRVPNDASLKALQRVGYNICGIEPRTCFRQGRFEDTHHLIWLNPERIELLYPKGLPEVYSEGIKRAQEAIKQAREVVSFP